MEVMEHGDKRCMVQVVAHVQEQYMLPSYCGKTLGTVTPHHKNTQKTRNRKNFTNMIKDQRYEKTKANIIMKGERLNTY